MDLDHWNLFVIWDLLLGIYSILIPITSLLSPCRRVYEPEANTQRSAINCSWPNRYWGGRDMHRVLHRLFGPNLQKHRLVIPIKSQEVIYLDRFAVQFTRNASSLQLV